MDEGDCPCGRLRRCATTTRRATASAELAEHFGVHESVASNICHGRTHPRVLPAEDLPPLPVRRTPDEEARKANRFAEVARRINASPR